MLILPFVFQMREFQCSNGDCSIRWGEVEEDEYIEFTVEGRVDGEQDYIALAFSKDTSMVISMTSQFFFLKVLRNFRLCLSIDPLHLPTIFSTNHLFIHPDLLLTHHCLTYFSTNHPTIHSTVQPSIHPTVHPTIHPSNYSFNHPSIQLFIQPSIHPTIHPTIHPSNYSSNHTSIQLFIQPSIHPTIHLTIHPSNYSSNHPSIQLFI